MGDQQVLIREHLIDDLEPYCEWQSDPEVARYVSWLPRSRSDSEASLRDAIAQQSANPRVRYFFAVVLAGSGEMVGDVGFTLMDSGVADCGWFIRRRYWGNGYGPAAVHHLVSYALSNERVRKLTASCSSRNASSIRVMEKCGFSLVRASEHRLWYSRG